MFGRRFEKQAKRRIVYSSDMEMKITHKMELENATREATVKKIVETDKLRANYYKSYTGKS